MRYNKSLQATWDGCSSFGWLPKPATGWVPQMDCSLRESWSRFTSFGPACLSPWLTDAGAPIRSCHRCVLRSGRGYAQEARKGPMFIEKPPKQTMEVLRVMGYRDSMSQMLEKRVVELERCFSELRAQVLDLRRRKQNWRSTVGTLENDRMTEEAERLGRKYRKEQTYQKEIAGT